MTREELIKHLAHEAQHRFGLAVWQWKPGPVGTHAPGSYHSLTFPDGVGQAFDAFAPMNREGRRKMGNFARWLARNYGDELSEGIYNPGLFKGWGKWSLSRKHGAHVGPIRFWGLTLWLAHRNHVHVAIGTSV